MENSLTAKLIDNMPKALVGNSTLANCYSSSGEATIDTCTDCTALI